MFYTVYKVTNKVNGKFYIGKHQTRNLDDDYKGSGKLIKAAIKKYGVDNFAKEILAIFDTEAQMNEAEKQFVVIGENSYNLCEGGKGGFGYINNHPLKREWSLKNVVQLQQAWKRLYESSEEFRQKHAEKMARVRELSMLNNGKAFAFFVSGTERQQRASMLSQSANAREKRKQTMKENGHQQGSKNSQFGKPRSEETKQKIRESLARTRATAVMGV